jgi:diguanylate cyclase (GGDEF)-like protein
MENIWEIYENLNEMVYVTDMSDDRLVYLNKRTRDMFGFTDEKEKDYIGKKCHEVIQGSATPCGYCNKRDLRPGYYDEWHYFNPMLRKDLLIKDTVVEQNGRRYRIGVAIDATAQTKSKENTQSYIAHATMINAGLKLALSSASPEESIRILMEYTGKALECDRFYIFEETAEHRLSNTYEWCAVGVEPEKEKLQDFPKENAKLWYQRFKEKQNVIVEDVEALKDSDPMMYDILEPQDIQSLIVSPLFNNSEIIGFYGVDNPPAEMMKNISTLFVILGHFLVSLLRRRDLVEKLRNLSFFDQLTGCGNRHAMEDYEENRNPFLPIGVVYCDVMGLKRINDSEGHKAGDRLLVRAADCLKRVFGAQYCYRQGGDEFLVLCDDLSEQQLLEKVQELKKEMKRHRALMAIGAYWRKDMEGITLDEVLTQADAAMYEDKRTYYKGIARDI